MTNGVLVIDKPSGPTSHDVVARVRRATQIRRIGHTGTLDPIATGVLPLVIGRATRLAQFLAGRDKTYEAVFGLGARTDTHDATGRPIGPAAPGAPAPSRHGLEQALTRFCGTFGQVPPSFSAKHVEGERAYRRARRQEVVVLEPVAVTVHELELLDLVEGFAHLRIVCSAGFYVRALARDLGDDLGCGAWVERLRRVRSGEFGLDHAVALATVEQEGIAVLARLVPMAALLPGVPGLVLTPGGLRRAAHGNAIEPQHVVSGLPPDAAPGTRVRLLDDRGELVALAESGPRFLRPVVVLM